MHDTAPIDPIRFTQQLCEIESTTYFEGQVGDFLAAFLAGRGWDVEQTPVPQPEESPGNEPRWNVYAGPSGQTPELVFSTHMDTVPPYVPFQEDEEFIYGRGVCDAKGIIAAQVAAAEARPVDPAFLLLGHEVEIAAPGRPGPLDDPVGDRGDDGVESHAASLTRAS